MNRKKTCIPFMFTLVLAIITFSCSDNPEPYTPTPNRNYTLEVGAISSYSIGLSKTDLSLFAVSADSSIVTAEIEYYDFKLAPDLKLAPQKTGKTTVNVLNGKNETVYTFEIEIVEGTQAHTIQEVTYKLEIIHESFTQAIKDEITNASSFGIGTTYRLTYHERTKGNLAIEVSGKNPSDIKKGTFYENDHKITFYYDNQEETFLKEVRPNFRADSLHVYFIKDYTSFFREKYPEAGVYKAQCIQKTNYPW